MSLADRLNILKEKNCCFACLNVGHSIRKCRIFLKYVVYGKKDATLMCEAVESRKHESKKAEEKVAANEANMSNISLGPKVFLQTLKLKMISDKKEVSVRIILDSGSRRSYILKSLAEEMGYIPIRKETLDLWKLDSIGIKDPIEKLSKKEQEDLTKEHFLQTVRYNDNKRYEVHLPWLDNCAPLPDNFELAIRRLESKTKKLLHEKLYDDYEGIFLEWLHEGIIEEVPVNEINLSGNYLPHSPVLKESSTTPIRPVFDASARMNL
ncbi:hypothetical protein AVEN_105035-1 [Araneus ventricosus]|uniref:Peptidase aspartic putative domain-containing protein n=1 Tax=Araneus ventricosus TaxID=182803 RepID=A0A4Y2N1S2_ARAVE|nr:hypothetical protein AVEN_105035-1 [Araneus ventricosus]